MPLFHEAAPGQPGIVVSGSIAVEVDWAMSAAWRPEFKRDHPVLARVFGQSPELGERVRSFWGPGETTSLGGSIELMILAHHGGLLFSEDAEHVLSRLEEVCAEAPGGLRLASESVGDRVALLARLERVRSSHDVRRRYVELVGDVWSALAADWEREGRPAVKVAVSERRGLQHKGASWREVAHDVGCSVETIGELVGLLGPQGTVAVIPAFFAHLGSLVDLPGTVLIGVRADGSDVQARARARLLAQRMKTISDPTRLAMLEALRWGPLTVGELATRFSLAQPTVSNHIKVLREAGIVSHGSDGGRRLVVQREVLADLLEQLEALFASPEQN